MLGNRLKQMKQQVSQRALALKDSAQKKWEEMQEAPDNIPEHWEQHTDDNGNKFYIDTSNGEMYRMNKRQHKRIDTIEKISLVEQMSKSPSSPINETAQKQPWICPSCTLENPGQATHCGACDTERPPEVEPETPSNLKLDKDKKLPAPSPSESKNQNEVSLNGGNKPDRPESASFDHKNDEDEKNEELSQNDTFIPQSQMNGSRQEQQHEPPRDNRNTESNMLDIPQQQGNNGSDDDYNDNGDADDPNGNEQSGHAQMSTMEQITAAIGDSLKSMGNADIDALNKDEQSVLLHFCELTDATPDAGLPFVQRASWDIERAVALYFDEHPNPTKSRQASAALGVDDIARILNEDPIADDDDIFVSSDPNNNNKRGSIDLDVDGVDGSQFVDPAAFNDVENEDGGHNRLTTKENIEVARIASLQQQFDQESEELRLKNDSLTVQNKDLLAQIEDLKQEKATLETELQGAKESAEFFEKKYEAERILNNQHNEARQQFQKDWDRMNTTFDQIIEELSAIRRGDPNQTQFTKLGELIQQVENLRSPGNGMLQNLSSEDAFDRVAGLFSAQGAEHDTPSDNEQYNNTDFLSAHTPYSKLTGITVTPPPDAVRKSDHMKKISMGGVSGIFSHTAPTFPETNKFASEMTVIKKQNSLTPEPYNGDGLSGHRKNRLSFGGVGDLFPTSPFVAERSERNEYSESGRVQIDFRHSNLKEKDIGMSVDDNSNSFSLINVFDNNATPSIYHNIDIMAETRQNNENWIEVANMFGANLDPQQVNVQGDGAEDGDQKASSHQRQASRSYETFHKQKSSDPTYDRQKPAHTRSEHSRGPSFTLAKDIFNGAEDGNEDAEAGGGDANVEDGQVNNRGNNPNDSDDETGMRRDSIAKSENDEDMIAVIAYYDIGGGDDDDDDGMHSRDSSWFGDYGRLPTSRRVSQKTPQTVKDLFDSDSNTLQNMNSNGINGIVRAVAASANASNAGSSTGTPQNYSAMREIGHGKRTSSGRASRGVNIQPPIPEEVENNTATVTVKDLFDADTNTKQPRIDDAIAKQERAHELLSKHEKEPSYSQVRAMFPYESSSESDDAGDGKIAHKKQYQQQQQKYDPNDPNFKATNLTPISTDSNRPSRGQKLGDVFNDVGAPNFAELEKSHLTPVALVTGLHGINDGPNEEKQRSKSDEEVEQEMRSKIRKEMEGEFATREKELREQIRADITNELTPQIAQEARTEMETEFEDKLKQETDRLRTELQNSFEYQIKTMKQEMKESEENHRIEVKSLENTKLDLIRSTSQEIESLRDIIKKYFAKVNRKAAEVTANNQNSSNVIKSMFFK